MTSKSNMRMVTVWIPKANVERLDSLVKRKLYPNRAEAIRFAIHDLLRRETVDGRFFIEGK
jgi:antitoxin ParD1/3/4